MNTLIESATSRFRDSPRQVAYIVRDEDRWVEVTWKQVSQSVRALSAAFADAGVQPGERVAVLGHTELWWVEAMLAVFTAGGVVSTIYPSSTPAQIRYILEDSGAVALVVQDQAALERVQTIRGSLPALKTVVVATGEPESGDALSWSAFLRAGRTAFASDPGLLDDAQDAVGPEDLAALVYTSGTTGEPKGVMLSHGNFMAVCRGIEDYLPLEDDDLQLLFLPLSHVFGMVVCLVSVHVGAPTILEPDVTRIGQTLLETQPTFMPAVPRVFEKIYASAEAKARSRSATAHRVFQWAARVAQSHSRATASGHVPLALGLQHRLADRLVLRKVRDGLGGRIRCFSSGAAPLSPDLAHFFAGANMPVLEGYGMTESTAITTVNPLDDWQIGTVGVSHDELRLRIAPDGEILLAGPTITRGYWNKPEATAAAIVDGWLHTGDIGAFDAQGHLVITDRKKHLIITAGGKNIAPSRVEAALVGGSDLVRMAMLHGDRRKHCVALVELEPEALTDWAARNGITGDPLLDPGLHERLTMDLHRTNASLASYESIKKVHLLRREPSVDSGEMTPSMKVKRKVLAQNYAEALDALYAADAPVITVAP